MEYIDETLIKLHLDLKNVQPSACANLKFEFTHALKTQSIFPVSSTNIKLLFWYIFLLAFDISLPDAFNIYD